MPYAPINGQEIFYEDSGGKGFPIVMMHGFLMDQSLFDPQVEALVSSYRCIRFDARAFGKTRWDKKAFSLYDTASDCAGLMDFLGIKRAVIAGMSQGGYAALRLALTKPERVTALILMSTQAGVDSQPLREQCVQMYETWKEVGPVPALLDSLATLLLGPNDTPRMAAHWNTWQPKWKAHTGEALFHAINNLINRDEISPKLSEIRHPAIVTHGDADIGVPLSFGRELCVALPNCQGLIVVPGAAHAANYTHAEHINPALLTFLEKVHS